MRCSPTRFNPPDWPAFFASRGFAIKQMRYLADEGQRLGRRPPTPWPLRLVMRFLPLRWRESRQKFTGYALLERRPTDAGA
jgi:hypothetical protein